MNSQGAGATGSGPILWGRCQAPSIAHRDVQLPRLPTDLVASIDAAPRTLVSFATALVARQRGAHGGLGERAHSAPRLRDQRESRVEQAPSQERGRVQRCWGPPVHAAGPARPGLAALQVDRSTCQPRDSASSRPPGGGRRPLDSPPSRPWLTSASIRPPPGLTSPVRATRGPNGVSIPAGRRGRRRPGRSSSLLTAIGKAGRDRLNRRKDWTRRSARRNAPLVPYRAEPKRPLARHREIPTGPTAATGGMLPHGPGRPGVSCGGAHCSSLSTRRGCCLKKPVGKPPLPKGDSRGMSSIKGSHGASLTGHG